MELHATLLSVTGLGALAINLFCAHRLARFRTRNGSLTRAAFSARNNALANLGIMAAGAATIITRAAWPDLVVGMAIFVMHRNAAWEAFSAARAERRAADSS